MNEKGSIAAGNPLTVAAGARILSEGGNAVDAAVAAAFSAFHCEPLLASGAGGGLLIAGNPTDGYSVLDFIPRVPGLGRSLDHPPNLDFHPVTIDFGVTHDSYHIGRGAFAVPTALIGLMTAHARWGKQPLAEVITPAVELCRKGFSLGPSGVEFIEILEPIWSLSDECKRLYTRDGKRATMGDLLTNPDFADVLEQLAREGSHVLTEGDIAEKVIRAFGTDNGGLITSDDLKQTIPTISEPLRSHVFDGVLLTPPPPSKGGTLISLSASLLSRCNLRPEDAESPKHITTLLQSELLALDIRQSLLEPNNFDRAIVDSLLSEAGIDAQFDRMRSMKPSGETANPARGCTTHISVLDREGGAAAVTLSNGEGCGHVIPGTGMHGNNFLGESDVNPDGFHVQPPGTTLPSMMAPTLFLRNGRPELIVGSGGSNRLRSAIIQVLLNRLAFRMSLKQAIGASRIHVEPNHFYAELTGRDEARLRSLGHDFLHTSFEATQSVFFGGVHGVAREPDGTLVPFGDPRRDGAGKSID